MYLLQYFIDKLSDHLKQCNKLEEVIREFQEKYNLLPCIGVEIEFYLSENINVEQFESLLGIKLKKEKGNNQYEINLPPSTDIINYIKEIDTIKKKIENIAENLQGKADLRAKPFANDYGNSMHFHVNFVEVPKGCGWQGKIDIIPAEAGIQGRYHGRHAEFISVSMRSQNKFGMTGKLLDSCLRGNDIGPPSNNSLNIDSIAKSICYYMLLTFLVFNTCDEDYSRFDKNFMTPINVSFGNNNRSVAVRIPDFLPKRIEHRIASPHTNVYIAIFTILNSILLGLKFPNQINNIEKIYGNAFDEQYNLPPLPKSIEESLKLFSLEFFIGTRQEGIASIESFLETMKKLEC
ncbi:MAG: glutamine synthetase [Candidatus Rickettsia vulgarisii]